MINIAQVAFEKAITQHHHERQQSQLHLVDYLLIEDSDLSCSKQLTKHGIQLWYCQDPYHI